MILIIDATARNQLVVISSLVTCYSLIIIYYFPSLFSSSSLSECLTQVFETLLFYLVLVCNNQDNFQTQRV